MDKESYRRGFEDALEALYFLVTEKKMDFKQAYKYLLKSVKYDKIEKILRDLGL